MDNRDGDWDICGKDLKTGEEFVVSDAPGVQTSPVASGDRAAWVDYDEGDTADVWVMNLRTGS